MSSCVEKTTSQQQLVCHLRRIECVGISNEIELLDNVIGTTKTTDSSCSAVKTRIALRNDVIFENVYT